MKITLLTTILALLANLMFGQISLVKDLNPGTNNSTFDYSFSFKGALYTEAVFDRKRRMVKTDGTEAGIVVLKTPDNIEIEEYVDQYYVIDGILYFKATTVAGQGLLCKTDGTTIEVIDTSAFSSFGGIYNFAEFKGDLYFSASYRNASFTKFDLSLFKYDGTTVTKVKDVVSGSSFYNITKLANSKYLFFSGYTIENGRELWRTDGTEAGTVLVKDIYEGSKSSLNNLEDSIIFNDVLYFTADNDVNGKELWRSDGTEAGTYMLKDIYDGSSDAKPANYIIYKNELYFTANDRDNSYGFKTDGTAAGTVVVGNNRVSNNTIIFKDHLYSINGKKLWKSDGTETGTEEIADAGFRFNTPYQGLEVYNNEIYFIHDNKDLFKTDGTTVGTVNLTNGNFEVANDVQSTGNKIYFVGTKTDTGSELYKYSDATASTSTEAINNTRLYYAKNTLHFKNLNPENYGVSVYNILGKKILETQLSSNQTSIANLNLSFGIYIVNVIPKNGTTFSKKIISK